MERNNPPVPVVPSDPKGKDQDVKAVSFVLEGKPHKTVPAN
jgi:hypothetical protein